MKGKQILLYRFGSYKRENSKTYKWAKKELRLRPAELKIRTPARRSHAVRGL